MKARGAPARAGPTIKVHASIGAPILITLVAIAPLALLHLDRWDGVMLSFALSSGDLTGVTVWFSEGKGPMTLALLRLIEGLGPIAAWANGRSLMILGVVSLMAGVFAAARRLPLPSWAGVWTAALVCINPMLSLMASSMLGVIAFWIGLGLMGFAASMSRSVWRASAGLAMMCAALELNSNFVLLGGLLAIAALSQWLTERRLPWRPIAFGLIMTVWLYVVYFKLAKPDGSYTGYHSFGIPEVMALPAALFGSIYLFSYLLPAVLICSLLLLPLVLRAQDRRRAGDSGWPIALLLLTALACATPYLLVDRTPPPFGFLIGFDTSNNYNYRHALPTVIASAMAVGGASALAFKAAAPGMWRLVWIAAVSLLMVGVLTVQSASAWRAIFARDAQAVALIAGLARSDFEADPICALDLSSYPAVAADAPRPYELAYYARLAGGQGATLLVASTTSQSGLNRYIDLVCRSDAHQQKYLTPKLDCEGLRETPPRAGSLPSCVSTASP